MEDYSEDAKAIFRKYDIPLFIDEKKSLSQNILIKFVMAMLDIFSSNWTYESVINYIKIGLLDISEEDIYKFENYCLKWGIKRSKWYSRKFDYEEVNDEQEHIEELRTRIIEPLLEFKKAVYENKTAGDITKELYNFIIRNNVCNNLNAKLQGYGESAIVDEYGTSYDMFISILSDIDYCLEKKKSHLINTENFCVWDLMQVN